MKKTIVVDASVAIKWLIPERDWSAARSLYISSSLLAPELICAECCNILWKKHQRNELLKSEVLDAVEQITAFGVELIALRQLTQQACELSLYLGHPAYDCFYLAVAIAEDCPLVTADERLLRVVDQKRNPSLSSHCISLQQFAVDS